MSLLLKLVSCCGPIGRMVGPSAEESGSLMRVSCGGRKRNRGGKLGGRNGKLPPQWRPSLCTISEDDDDVIKAEKEEEKIRGGNELMRNICGSKAKFKACRFGCELRQEDLYQYNRSIQPFSTGAFFLF